MNSLGSLTILTLVSVSIPGPAKLISKSLIQMAQFDIFPTTYLLQDFLGLEYSEQVLTSLSPQLDDLGFGSLSMTLNMGSASIYLLINFSLYLLLIMLDTLKAKAPVFQRVYNKLWQTLIWGLAIRFFTQQYLTLFLSGLIYMENVSCIFSNAYRQAQMTQQETIWILVYAYQSCSSQQCFQYLQFIGLLKISMLLNLIILSKSTKFQQKMCAQKASQQLCLIAWIYQSSNQQL
ncbi:hypothetical protein FGO68_gene11478 [Halteria grandinella]|uniref:Transmembrane protein n=1 Tax=Halteria grandinella TaxID=5974 RepID=A0A8J8TBC4_HALGN|nr:hypothetical protein FGO68_gene11478 [Halteria grandinella]